MLYLSAASAHQQPRPTERGRTVLRRTIGAFAGLFLVVLVVTAVAPPSAAASEGSTALADPIVDVLFCAGGKIEVCHRSVSDRSHTISVCRAAWPAHERHGDTLGPCSDDGCTARSSSSCDGDSDSDRIGDADDDSDSDSDGDGAAACLTDADCDDGDVCNGIEVCGDDHRCVSGEAIACDDGNVCNGVETCDPNVGCVPGAALTCDDGDVCNGIETCDPEHGCVAGTPLECDDGIYCNGPESCDPVSGCRAGCPPCDDGISCTADSCDEATHACAHVAVDERCDDGNPCNGVEVCGQEGCASTTDPVDCKALDSVCGLGVCDESTGDCTITPVNEGAACDDGDDACTLSDRCVDGRCAGTPVCDVECERCDGGSCISLCGNPFDESNDRVSVVDALFALRASVELETCPLCRCDVNGDGVIGSSDALRILWRVVRLPVDFFCPPSGNATTTTLATTTTSLAATSTTVPD